MKKQVFILLLAFFGFALQSQASSTSSYVIDDEAVEAVFESSVQVNAMAGLPVASVAEGQSVTAMGSSPAVAFILSWLTGFAGGHRWYLGTDTSTKVLYCVTIGGCGIVWFGDTLLLLIGLIKDDIDQYVDNDSFIMW